MSLGLCRQQGTNSSLVRPGLLPMREHRRVLRARCHARDSVFSSKALRLRCAYAHGSRPSQTQTQAQALGASERRGTQRIREMGSGGVKRRCLRIGGRRVRACALSCHVKPVIVRRCKAWKIWLVTLLLLWTKQQGESGGAETLLTDDCVP
ncbi:hypothetical protein EJ03DRAFT_154841 [Teratosphaeria nubilosa]|uniref:Uncharacterized protein n=1 Tax=Teratosphaeria nubilosa TaxID=161662 RepID=A0A6G1LL42_9PEZI|nr:hypothetical protein EJ03DRAFT_154841 [Teratosphaeria nubilosa]